MGVTHPQAVRDGVCNFVVDQIDEGVPPGRLVFLTAGGAAVATLTFSTPAFGPAASGVAVANAIASDINAIGGTTTKAEFRNAAGTPKAQCSVTVIGGGGDIQLTDVDIDVGQTLSISSLAYEAMP